MTVPTTGVAPGPVKVKVAVVTVRGSIASLNTAFKLLFVRTPVALGAGTVEVTVGGVVSGVAPVVKVHTKLLASALPARSLAPVVMAAVNRVLPGSGLVGIKVAVTPT